MGGTIYEDTRQHDGKHRVKHAWFEAHGVGLVRQKLDFGDYMRDGSNVSVDTKADVYELMGNLGAGYRRVDHECARAAEAGYRLVFLVEGGARYAEPGELAKVASKACRKCTAYRARKCSPQSTKSGCIVRGARRKPFQGYQMIGRMKTLHTKYGAEFEFVGGRDSARRICELLGVEYDEQDASCRA